MVFASYETERVRFELGGCGIDVDAASFGHAVVEVEAGGVTLSE